MKRILSLTAAILSLSLLFTPALPSFAAQKPATQAKTTQKKLPYKPYNQLVVKIDDTVINPLQKPVLYNDYVMLPLKPFLEVVGYKVTWDGKKNQVYASHSDGDEIYVKPGSKVATISDEELEYDVPSITINGTLYVPAGMIADALYKEVELDDDDILYFYDDYEDDTDEEPEVYVDEDGLEYIWKEVDGELRKFDPTGTYGLDTV